MARFVAVKDAGHWVHADNPAGFLGVMEAFVRILEDGVFLHHQTAIHMQRLAGDIPCAGESRKATAAGDFLWQADAAERDVLVAPRRRRRVECAHARRRPCG